jgi:hypothetical protein
MSQLNKIQNNQNNQKNFMGVVINPKGPTNPIVLKALAYPSSTIIGIAKFVEVTDFKLNMVMFDYFWQVVVGSTSSAITTRVLEWFGYEGDFKIQKQNFIRMLKNNTIIYKELTQKDKEIELYPEIQNEIQALPSNVQNSKFLIMEPDDIKMAIMQLKTKNGHAIRQYYIDLEKLMKVYVEYTLYFNHRESRREITSLEQMMADMNLKMKKQEIERQQDREMMKQHLNEIKDQNDLLINQNDDIQGELAVVQDKLDCSLEDRCPKVQTNNKLEQFVLLKKNKPADRFPYYVICGQQVYVNTRMTSLKKRYPKMTTLLKLEYQPNTKNLFGRFKETHKDDVVVKMNDIQLVTITEKELIEAFEKLDDEKSNV